MRAIKPKAQSINVQADRLRNSRTGATLPPDKRKRAQEIADELERLSLQFNKNVNEDPTLSCDAGRSRRNPVRGWPAAIAMQRQSGAWSRLPDVVPFCRTPPASARRKVLWAKNREGGNRICRCWIAR